MSNDPLSLTEAANTSTANFTVNPSRNTATLTLHGVPAVLADILHKWLNTLTETERKGVSAEEVERLIQTPVKLGVKPSPLFAMPAAPVGGDWPSKIWDKVPSCRKGFPWSDADIAALKDLREQGVRADDISAKMGRTADAIKKKCESLGLKAENHFSWRATEVETATSLARIGISKVEIAKRLNRSFSSVRNYFRRHGIKIKKPVNEVQIAADVAKSVPVVPLFKAPKVHTTYSGRTPGSGRQRQTPPWTAYEDKSLREAYEYGTPIGQIANSLKRNYNDVYRRITADLDLPPRSNSGLSEWLKVQIIKDFVDGLTEKEIAKRYKRQVEVVSAYIKSTEKKA